MVEMLPNPIPYLIGAAILLAVLLAYDELYKAYKRLQGPVNIQYARYDKRDYISVWEAAFLFTERQPIPPPARIQYDFLAMPFWEDMHDRIKNKQITDIRGRFNRKEVAKSELLRYAEQIGERPSFLYEDQRPRPFLHRLRAFVCSRCPHQREKPNG